MNVIGSMTRLETIRVEEEAQNLLLSIESSQLTIHGGEARLDFYPAEVHGNARKRATKKKAELLTAQDAIGLTAQPIDIKLDDAETSITIHVVDPNAFLANLTKATAGSRVTAGASNGVNSLKALGRRRTRGNPKHASFFGHILQLVRRTLSPNVLVTVCLLLASIWFFYRDVMFFCWLRKNGIEEMACKTCYAKGVYSFFQASFYYLLIVISMLGYVYVAAHIVRTRSSGPYYRFAAFETFRKVEDFFIAVYNYYALPTHVRLLLTPSLFKSLVCSHFCSTLLVMLLLWKAKLNAGYRSLLRNAFGALLISILITSSHFYCLSALHEKLIPGVDFHSYLDTERGLIAATEGL